MSERLTREHLHKDDSLMLQIYLQGKEFRVLEERRNVAVVIERGRRLVRVRHS